MNGFKLCGVNLKSPFIIGSGPLSYGAEGIIRLSGAGAGAVVTKTIRLNACVNPVPHIAKSSGNTLINCEKWSDLPPEAWIDEELPKAKKAGAVVIASLGHNVEETSRLIEKVAGAGADMIELVSYDGKDMLPMVMDAKARVSIPVFVKLSPNWENYLTVARECAAAGADGFTAFDSIGPVLRIDIRTGRPFMGGAGGNGWLSGEGIRPVILQKVAELRKEYSGPIIGLGGVACAGDAVEMLMAGADLIGICSVLILKGVDYLKRLTEDFDRLTGKLGYNSIAEITSVSHKYLYPGDITGKLNFSFCKELCNGCGSCARVCCYEARTISRERDMSFYEEKCRYCGACLSICSTGALKAKLIGE